MEVKSSLVLGGNDCKVGPGIVDLLLKASSTWVVVNLYSGVVSTVKAALSQSSPVQPKRRKVHETIAHEKPFIRLKKFALLLDHDFLRQSLTIASDNSPPGGS